MVLNVAAALRFKHMHL